MTKVVVKKVNRKMQKLRLKESELVRLIEKTIKENNYKSLKEQTQLPKGHELRQEFEILNRKLDRILRFVEGR